MRLQMIDAPGLATGIAPLSHAVIVGELVFCSGQVPLAGERVLESQDVGEMTRQVLSNLDEALRAAGSSLARVVRTTVYLADLDDYAAMNAVYAEMLAHHPARTCVQVAALPLAVRVEIDCIAALAPRPGHSSPRSSA